MWVVLIIIILIAIWAIGTYNGFVRAENSVEEAFSTMDVYLKKRFDLIPNLVETVKGYTDYESSTLQAVINARNSVLNASTTNAKIEGENQLTGSLRQLFALAESYPDLKANSNYQELMQQLQKIEEDIANARKYYNAVVKNYNIRLQSFPSSVIGSLFHYSKKAMYEAYDDERTAVKVDFSRPTEAADVVEAAADLRADMSESLGEAEAKVEEAVKTQEM